MSLPGELDQAYVLARKVLLDALGALRDQLPALTLVGAQAIYLHIGEADFAVLPYTTDGDIALDPRVLVDDPELEDAMRQANFLLHPTDVGIWLSGKGEGPQVDLLVPEAIGGAGRRGARLGVHGKRAAHKVRGLEGALIDRTLMNVGSLDSADDRRFEVAVAGPAALVVAKLHKLAERQDQPRRQDEKDAFDVYRLLSYVEAAEMATRVRMLAADPIAGDVTRQALDYLRQLFSTAESIGSQMAGRNVEAVGDPAFVAAAVSALAVELLEELDRAVS